MKDDKLIIGDGEVFRKPIVFNGGLETQANRQLLGNCQTNELQSLVDDENFLNDEVEKINQIIENEKKSYEKDSLIKKRKFAKSNNNEPVKSDEKFVSYKAPAEQKVLMERLHLRIFDNTIDVLYRPNHNYITFLPNDENGRAEVKRIAKLSREEFEEYLKEKKFKKVSKSEVDDIKSSKLEEWYQGAWSLQTKKMLEELKVENPIEEPLWIN